MATTARQAAFAAAKREGLAYHQAWTHVGTWASFVGQSWEDGGYHVGPDGSPRSDSMGNTVSRSSIEQLDPVSGEHAEAIELWYGF